MVNIYTGFSSEHSKTELIKRGNISFINFFHVLFNFMFKTGLLRRRGYAFFSWCRSREQ